MLIKNILIFILNSKRNKEKKVEKLGRATAKILMIADLRKETKYTYRYYFVKVNKNK